MGGIWVPVDITNYLAPVLGIGRDFITMMRANWMLKGGAEKLISFYYQSQNNTKPSLKTSTKIIKKTRFNSISKVRFPYSLDKEIFSLAIDGRVKKFEEMYEIFLENKDHLKKAGSVLICSKSSVLKILPFVLEEYSTYTFTIERKRIEKYLLKYRYLEIIVIDRVERLKLIDIIRE